MHYKACETYENSSQFQVTDRLQAVFCCSSAEASLWSFVLHKLFRSASLSVFGVRIKPGRLGCLFLIYVNAWYRKLCKNLFYWRNKEPPSVKQYLWCCLNGCPGGLCLNRETLQQSGEKSPINESTLSLFFCLIHGPTNSTPRVYLIKLRLWPRQINTRW